MDDHILRANVNSTVENPLVAIAARITRVRQNSGLNQAQFAERLGFPKRTYLGWERAETEPPIWMLSAMRDAFGIDPDWILRGPDATPRRHVSEVDWERLQRLQEDIRVYAQKIGLEPNCRQLLDLAKTIFEEAEDNEQVALGRMKATLKAMVNGKV